MGRAARGAMTFRGFVAGAQHRCRKMARDVAMCDRGRLVGQRSIPRTAKQPRTPQTVPQPHPDPAQSDSRIVAPGFVEVETMALAFAEVIARL